MPTTRTVVVCQNNACRKAGAAKVLAAFQQALEGVTIQASGCLGQCGNGPMVLILPEQVWYCQVHPDEVPTVIQRHVQQGTPVKAMLYRKFHPDLF